MAEILEICREQKIVRDINPRRTRGGGGGQIPPPVEFCFRVLRRGYTDRQINSPPRIGIRENVLCPLNEMDGHTVSPLTQERRENILVLIMRYRFSTVN